MNTLILLKFENNNRKSMLCGGNQRWILFPLYRGNQRQWGFSQINSSMKGRSAGVFLLVHVMMTSSNRNIFRITGPLCGELTGHQWNPLTKASDAQLWCFYDLRLNKRLSKRPRRRWFQKPSHSLWRHCNGLHRSWMKCIAFRTSAGMMMTVEWGYHLIWK